MISIKNKHGLWYHGNQTWGGNPLFLETEDSRKIYHSFDDADIDIAKLEKKYLCMKNEGLKAVTVYPKTRHQDQTEIIPKKTPAKKPASKSIGKYGRKK